MKLLPVFGIGALRISQSAINKQTSKYMHDNHAYFRYGLYFESLAALFSCCYLFFAGFKGWNLPTLICAAITGICFLAELLTSLKALTLAPLPLCTLCSLGGGIILPALFGIFFFNEPMSIFQWLGVALFFLSVYFLMPQTKRKVKLETRAILILLGNFIINGTCGFIGKYFAVNVPNGNAALFAFLCYAFASLFFALTLLILKIKVRTKNEDKSLQKREKFLEKPLYFYGIAVGAVCATIVYFSTVLSRTIPIIILNTLPNCICLLGTLFLGVWVFKEKLTVLKVVGVILSALSTTIIILF